MKNNEDMAHGEPSNSNGASYKFIGSSNIRSIAYFQIM